MFTVITDTSGNLPTPLLKKRNIGLLPFVYYMDGKEHTCVDTEAYDGPAFFQAIRDGAVVTTSQINPQTYRDCFEAELREGRDVLYVSMSSGISGSCDSARLAARELAEEYPGRRVEVIDTRGASLGEGLLAVMAADMRDAGLPLEEAAERLDRLTDCMCNVFTVGDLMHLKRTGRLSNLSAILGMVLNIKPLLKGNEEGKIVSFGKLRGRQRAVEALAEIYNARVAEPEKQTVGISHGGCRQDAERLAALLREKQPPKEILIVDHEPVTGAHVGPDMLALFFLADEEVRSVRWPVQERARGEIRLPISGRTIHLGGRPQTKETEH